MGRVVVEATLDNLEDLWAVRCGVLTDDRVRRESDLDLGAKVEGKIWIYRPAKK